MPVSVRVCALAVLVLLLPEASASATDGVYLPSAPRGSGGEDSIETAGGTRRRPSINSHSAYFDKGAAASAAKPLPDTISPSYSRDRDQEALVYFRITMPIGRKPERIDCSRLYEMEIQRLREELELLKMAVE